MRYDKDGLTYRERDIYNYIVKFKQINGYAPTINEIARALFTSRSFVSTALARLSDKGIIKYIPNKYRTITILKFLEEQKQTG